MNNRPSTTEQTFNHIWSRICQITGWKAQSELASFLNVKPSSVSGAKHRDKFPLDWAFRIAQRYNYTTDWIMTGGSSCIHPAQNPIPHVFEREGTYTLDEKWSIVPHQYSTTAKPLTYVFAVPTPKDPGKHLGFVSCRMPDDTMEPTIRKGELLLIDLNKNKIDCSGIYALKSEETIVIKRIELHNSFGLSLISDNPLYENRTTPIDTIKSSLVGRITCHARSF